jgi:protocatechuate 3,4-dioxygenase beta subunit
MGFRLGALTVGATVSLLLVSVTGCSANSPPDASKSGSDGPQSRARRYVLEPTRDDGLSPSYEPGAPTRSVVGTGHVLTGSVVSSRDGSPIGGAKLELWPEYAGRGHPDEARATVVTDRSGRYRFQCDPPEHIHMRITAAGYVGIAQNGYHPGGQTEGSFDIVLRPE